MNLNAYAVAHATQIAELRRDLHAHPELSYAEHRTAELVAKQLTAWGIAVVRGVGKTGVVGTIVGRHPVPDNVVNAGKHGAIALRADMDALPLQEANQFSHASVFAGKMHACGHDGHTAMLLGAAQALAHNPDFAGTVYVVFQPAEEGGAGAQAMIDDGLLTRFPMDAIFGLHNWPGLPLGHIALSAGAMMASSNEFTLTVTGKGGHAAMPHESNDPIMAAVTLAQTLQTIVSRNTRPLDAAVLSITQIHAGDAYNVIPNTALLRGTVRTFSLEVLDVMETRLREICQGVAHSFGVTVAVQFERSYPPLINSETEAQFCRDIAKTVVGDKCVSWNQTQTMGAEDFAFMLLHKAGCYVFMGNDSVNPHGTTIQAANTSRAVIDHRPLGHGAGPCLLHNPSYDFNDQLIPIGVSYWVALVQGWFQQP
jgi:amidohydrolase